MQVNLVAGDQDQIHLTLNVEDAEYVVEVFESRMMQHTHFGKPDVFDAEITRELKSWVEAIHRGRQRAKIDEQIARLERERDSI